MNLFAYGTLMAADGLRAVLGTRVEALTFKVARLTGWRRVWNVHRDEWGGGVLNVERAPGAAVVGVLIEGLNEDDLALLDRQESTHLPRDSVYVQPEGGEPVAAQIYWRRRGNHSGPPSSRYEAVVQERARQAGPAVQENLSTGSVDPAGQSRRIPISAPSPEVTLAMAQERVPAIKVLLLPKDTNALGTIFGGVILSHIDLASAVEARKVAARRYVTKAMREVEFHEPVFLGDIVNFFTKTVSIGRTSITVKVSVEAERWGAGRGERVKVTEAEVVLVAVNENGRPTSIR
jgi:acyl-CoA thioesterase YciA